MELKNIVQKYLDDSFLLEYAEAHAASDIILSAISKSKNCDDVTIKGGVLIYNLTNDINRPTTDLDFDFIHYSIKEESVKMFIKNIDLVSPYSISVKKLSKLHHADYKGVRAIVCIKDKGYKINFKLDIGVHSYSDIKQDKLVFSTTLDSSGVVLLVNPKEQIITEKLFSLARLGPISTRYKDIYDIYNMIITLDKYIKLKDVINIFLKSKKYPFDTISDLYRIVKYTLTNVNFATYCTEYLKNKTTIIYKDMVNIIIKCLEAILD